LRSNSSDLTLHEWSISPETYIFAENTNANSRNPVVLFGEVGTYDVSLKVTNTFGSADTTKLAYIMVSPFSSIQELKKEFELEIFPNPAADYLEFRLSEVQIRRADIYIYNSIGKLLKQQQGQSRIDISDLKTGIYFFEVRVGEQRQIKTFMVK
ncbi:MAG: T9SS type A sorting domain-containing protein, partial [Bacteroidota bacterium]